MTSYVRITKWMALIIGLVLLAGCHRFVVPANSPTTKITLKTAHGRWVVAQGEDQDWALWQSDEPDPGECGWFIRHELGRDEFGQARIALETCYGRFVTVPRRGTSRLDLEVWQDSGLGDCAYLTVEPHENRDAAFRTCTGKYLTAGDAGPEWPTPWAIVVEADQVRAWEIFKIMSHQ